MLVLNRRAGDTIHLAGGIRIVVLSADRGGVRLGIEAPRSVSILRGELVEAVAHANREALAHGAGTYPESVGPIGGTGTKGADAGS